MGLNTLERYFTDKAAPYIEEAGGKIGGLNYLKATVPQLRNAILPIQVVKPNERVKEVKVPAGEDGRFIVRGSHWMDFQGLVDVLDTQVGEEPGYLALDVREYAKLPYIMAYGKYENPAYDGRICVGIQPYIHSQRGSIVEHPNIPNQYVVFVVEPDYETGRDSALAFLYSIEENDCHRISGDFEISGGTYEDRVREIVEMYRQVDGSGLVKPGYSFQMEFLNTAEQVYIAQVRAFKKKEEARFELEADDRLVFGITPPEGIVLPVYLSPDGFSHSDYPNPDSAWAYLKPCETSRSWRDLLRPKDPEQVKADLLRFQPQRLTAYLIGQSFASQVNTTLEHNHFRVAQKADVTVFEGAVQKGDFTRLFYSTAESNDPMETHLKLDRMLRSQVMIKAEMGGSKSVSRLLTDMFGGLVQYKAKIISNGRTATVEPVVQEKPKKRGSRNFSVN